MDDSQQFHKEVNQNIKLQGKDVNLKAASIDWMMETGKYRYSYMFQWLGRPIIQLPQDIVAMQELIWEVRPDLIIETGIARGGSVIFYASMLELLGNGGQVIGIDIDIRTHNRAAIEKHPMFKNIRLLEGSSICDEILNQVDKLISQNNRKNVMVVLDSNHAHEHVLGEMRCYSPYVKKGSYIVVFDTIIEDMPEGCFSDRPWDKGSNPMTAIRSFLEENDRFVIDERINSKLLISYALGGYLKCVK